MGLVYSQMGDPSFTHGAGDGFHCCAQRVQKSRQLPCAFCLSALLHHKTGHGDHVGVEGSLVGHGGGWSSLAVGVEEMLQNFKCNATRKTVRGREPIRSATEAWSGCTLCTQWIG